MTQETKKKRAIPAAAEIEVAPTGYQPSKAEQEEEIAMPSLSIEKARNLFMRPFRIVRADPSKRR